MKRSNNAALPLRPLKKRNAALSTSPCPSTDGTNLATPLRPGSNDNNSNWVTPSLREPYRNDACNPDAEFGSLETPTTNQSSKQQDSSSPIETSPMPLQKENLQHQFRPPRISAQDKNRAQLKAVLHRNGQSVTGTVRVLQNRVADGEAYGKLGLCPRCRGGKLKMEDEDPRVVYCSRKALCGFQCYAHVAPRSEPWTCVSFDDDQEDYTSNHPDPGAAASTTYSGPPPPANTTIPAARLTVDSHVAITPRPEMPPLPPSFNGPNTMYQYHPDFTSPPRPYWNSHNCAPQPFQGQYPYYYPPQMSYHPRRPLHPLQMGYPPMPPVPPHPSTFRKHERVHRESNQDEGYFTRDKQWFPLSDPAYFPDRGAARHPRPLQEEDPVANRPLDQKKSPGACNHSPAEVAMATKAAEKALQQDGKNLWTAEEDAIVYNSVTGTRSENFKAWTSLVALLPGRTGKQIRDRWVNHLNPNLVHTPFDQEEDLLLWDAFLQVGKCWKEISVHYFRSKRSENKVKNRFHSVPFQKFISETVGREEFQSAIAKFKD